MVKKMIAMMQDRLGRWQQGAVARWRQPTCAKEGLYAPLQSSRLGITAPAVRTIPCQTCSQDDDYGAELGGNSWGEGSDGNGQVAAKLVMARFNKAELRRRQS